MVDRILVTGSRGFIGSALMGAFEGEVIGLDVADADIVADVGDPGDWQGGFGGVDVVVHTAALVGMPSDTSDFWRVNAQGTRHVLDAAIRAGVRRFVLLSSVTVFGNDFPDGVTEDTPLRPTGVPYADSKIVAEHLCLQSSQDIEVVIVRPGDVYGPGSGPWTVQPVQMIRSRRVTVPSTGVLSPVFISDLATGIVAAATSAEAAGIVTLAGGIAVPTGEFFDHYARMLGRRRVPRLPRSVMLGAAGVAASVARLTRSQVELSPDAVRYLSDRRGTYSIDRAASLLGWRPSVDLDSGMAATQRWLRAQGYLD